MKITARTERSFTRKLERIDYPFIVGINDSYREPVSFKVKFKQLPVATMKYKSFGRFGIVVSEDVKFSGNSEEIADWLNRLNEVRKDLF